MPKIKPIGGEVDWSEDEGVLGVVGVAPWATIEFCKIFYTHVKATKDWHYPRVLIDLNTKLPSRGRHFELDEADPSPYIAETIRELYTQGATVVVVPCNTAHILYDSWAREAKLMVLNIVNETLLLAKKAGVKNIVPLVSATLAKHDLYGICAEREEFNCLRLNQEDQILINKTIDEIKQCGVLSDPSLNRLDLLINKLIENEVESVIIGCTELSVLCDQFSDRGLMPVDSNAALAKASLNALGMRSDLLL